MAWVAIVLGSLLLLLMTSAALAASPEPSPSPQSTSILGTGDPRSDGQGPGLVGSPFAVALGVVALGAVAAGGTLLYLRATRDD